MSGEEVVISALDYYEGDELASGVWKGKYALFGEDNPNEMHVRITKELDRKQLVLNLEPEIWKSRLSEYGCKYFTGRRDYMKYLKDFKYIIPQGSIMAVLGSGKIGSISNCFVIPPPVDSYGGIFTTDQQIAQIEKRRGGVGTNLNTLRPDGTLVNNIARSSTGAHSFMERFSNTTREVAQNGRK